ncbi:MAG: murein L,D-transpeptidase catalytic domain-containing protein [Ferruginibacter sp.]
MMVSCLVLASTLFYYTSIDKLPTATSLHVLKESKFVAINNTASLKLHAAKIKPYLRQHAYNEQICFLVDMKIAPGKNRFFLYDFKKDTVVAKGLVTHGSGSQTTTEALSFSNIANSNATSVGRYKIGNEYSGKFGMAFKLHGLDKTNSNAFNRFVVLHSHSCVPDAEVYPSPICTSLGCPTVAPSFLLQLKKYIEQSDKPVLLWIYY